MELFSFLKPKPSQIACEDIDWESTGKILFLSKSEQMLQLGQINDLKTILLEAFAKAIANQISAKSLAAILKQLHLNAKSFFVSSEPSSPVFYVGPLLKEDPLLLSSIIIDILWILDLQLDSKSALPKDEVAASTSSKNLLDERRKQFLVIGNAIWVSYLLIKEREVYP
jgi:hypothetical protein